MAKNKSIFVYKRKTDDNVKNIIDNIVSQLEYCGRAVSSDGKAVKIFSRYMEDAIKQEQIYFTWKNKSIITLPPSIQLIRIKNNRIKLIFNKDFRNKDY